MTVAPSTVATDTTTADDDNDYALPLTIFFVIVAVIVFLAVLALALYTCYRIYKFVSLASKLHDMSKARVIGSRVLCHFRRRRGKHDFVHDSNSVFNVKLRLVFSSLFDVAHLFIVYCCLGLNT